MMIELLLFVLFIIVLVTIVVQVYVYYVSVRFMKVLIELIKMDEQSGFDPVWLIKNLEPFLNRMMVRDYGYYVFYLNTEYEKPKKLSYSTFHKFVYTADYSVFLEITPQKYRLNARRLNKALIQVLFLMIKSDINLSVKSAENAFKRSAEIQTFINHDVKNLIQFVNMLEFNLNNAKTDEDNRKLTKYLRKSIPGLKNRADKVLAALNATNHYVDNIMEKFDPYALAEQIADSYGLSLQFESDLRPVINANKKVVSIIFENVIKNFYDKSLAESGIDLFMRVADEPDAVRIFMRDSGSALSDCEKIFEPFYSGRNNGLGIGLFHCRSVASSAGGRFWAENTPYGPVFILEFKKADRRF